METLTKDKKIAIQVPLLFYWEDEIVGIMTCAFKWKGQNFGLSFPLEKNLTRRRMDKKKLVAQVRDTLDMLWHHGKDILDRNGNVDYRIVNDKEAAHAFRDKDWISKVAFVRSVLKNAVKDITREQAVRLGLL